MKQNGLKGAIKVVGCYKFNISDVLGKGSFGVVYKCTHIETQEELALKAMPRPQTQYQEDLNKEIAIMTKLKGPNIVRFREVLGTANNIYIAIDLCDSDLYKQIQLKKIFKQEEAIKIMTDVLKGFLELIENGIIHRDLKPANILIKNDVYKLADFGFAREVEDLKNQQFSTVLGTPMYMSPQILEGNLYTTKSDICSFGFIFYELLYGRTPWYGNSQVNLYTNILYQDLTFPDQTNKVSDLVKDVLSRCLAKKEPDRITWLELFRHPVFCENFQEVQNLQERCNHLEQFIATNLRIQIANQNISIEHLIKFLVIYEIRFQFITFKDKVNRMRACMIQRMHCIFLNTLLKFTLINSIKNRMEKWSQRNLNCQFCKILKLIQRKVNQNYFDQKIQESFSFTDKEDKGFITIEELQQALDNLKH